MIFSKKMLITVKAKPKAKVEKVEKLDEKTLKVFVKEPPERGKANEAIVEALAKYFNVSKSKVKIISGHKSNQKLVEVKL